MSPLVEKTCTLHELMNSPVHGVMSLIFMCVAFHPCTQVLTYPSWCVVRAQADVPDAARAMRGRILDAFTDAVDGMCAALDPSFPAREQTKFFSPRQRSLFLFMACLSIRARGEGGGSWAFAISFSRYGTGEVTM